MPHQGQKPTGCARVPGVSLTYLGEVYAKSLGLFRQSVFPFDNL
jgi:hypothetical protein